MTLQIVLALLVFVAVYFFIATEKLPRVTVALGGAAAMVLIGATDAEHAFFSEQTGVDWNVIFLLLGMMIIVGILRQTGVFEFLAIWSAKRARGKPFLIMAMMIVITGVLSAFLDNVTTILLVVPVTILVCDRLGVPPIPYLIAEVMASNIGGAATLIGDPPNIIIASPSRGNLSFNDFLINMAPIVVVLLAVLIVLSRFLFRSAFVYNPDRAARVMALNEREALRDKTLLIKSLVVVGLVLIAFVLHSVIGLDVSVVAMLGAGLLVLLTRLGNAKTFGDVEWETLLFFAGLFIMVGSLVNLGIIEAVGQAASGLIEGHYLAGAIALLVGSAVLSGVIDNIPYVTTMAPLTADLVAGGGDAAKPLWWALALGADLGGNATAIGASANVVMIGIAKRNDIDISFWTFTKYGLIVTAVTVAICVPYLWLRYFV
ncbi:MAG TPA: ArsB/NhaD family transporter [Microlunatus sp.]